MNAINHSRPHRANYRPLNLNHRPLNPTYRPHNATYRPHNPTADRRGSHRAAPRPADAPPAQRPNRRQPRAQLISDAVVASYIHDISRRHSDHRPTSG
jgi:hypothetical protein